MTHDVGTLTTHKEDRELTKRQHSSYRHSVVSCLKILPWWLPYHKGLCCWTVGQSHPLFPCVAFVAVSSRQQTKWSTQLLFYSGLFPGFFTATDAWATFSAHSSDSPVSFPSDPLWDVCVAKGTAQNLCLLLYSFSPSCWLTSAVPDSDPAYTVLISRSLTANIIIFYGLKLTYPNANKMFFLDRSPAYQVQHLTFCLYSEPMFLLCLWDWYHNPFSFPKRNQAGAYILPGHYRWAKKTPPWKGF